VLVRRVVSLALVVALAAAAGCGDDEGSSTAATATTLDAAVTVPAGGGYEEVPRPTRPPGHTSEVSDPLADGTYWATVGEVVDEGEETGVTFKLVQAFFGSECLAHFEGDAEACLDDYGVDDSSTETVMMPLDTTGVTVLDTAATITSYRITGRELARLVEGDPPGADAPEDYVFSFFPFLVTIVDGAVIAAHQVFTP
jgi:hypothetical protein